MKLLTSWMCRAHCHRVIKLSGTLQQFAPEKELVENVHGVRRTFLDVGDELRTKLTSSPQGGGAGGIPVFGPDADPTAYFIGKMLWSKGLASLMDLMKYAEESAGLRVKMDMYGGGPDKDEASAKAAGMALDMPFHGPIDHAELGWTHKVFINPSLSEVLCTTVAEALAMGKFVVLPSHPSNDFFAQFPNCLPYTNKEEFVGKHNGGVKLTVSRFFVFSRVNMKPVVLTSMCQYFYNAAFVSQEICIMLSLIRRSH